MSAEDDPIYPIVRALFPRGARLDDIARIYGYTKQMVSLVAVSTREKLAPLRELYRDHDTD